MLRGFPQEDLIQDEGQDNDVLGDRPQAGEVSEVDSPSLANSEDLEGRGPHEPGLPERPDTPDDPEGSDLECSVPELGDGRLRLKHECRDHWPYDRGCDDCVQSRGRTPARRVQSRSLSGRHISTSFLDPVLGAMMKQVCWHSRRSKACRGLPEARMAASRLLRMC